MRIMKSKVLPTLFIALFSWIILNAAIPALSSTPISEVKPKLKNKNIIDIVVESKVYFLNNPDSLATSRIFDIVDSILEDPLLAKKIAQAQNPSDNFDLFLSMREALQTVINNQKHLPTTWVNLTSVQKLRRTLIYLLAIYPQSSNINELLSYCPKSLYLKYPESKENQDKGKRNENDHLNAQETNNGLN